MSTPRCSRWASQSSSPGREDLLRELDAAMGRIQDENRSYNQQLYDRFVRATGISSYVDQQTQEWLEQHGPIRVGYLEDDMPFCGTDPDTGELTGALKTYLDQAATATQNAVITFSAHPYATQKAAIQALQAGEIDCVFPST